MRPLELVSIPLTDDAHKKEVSIITHMVATDSINIRTEVTIRRKSVKLAFGNISALRAPNDDGIEMIKGRIKGSFVSFTSLISPPH